MVKAPSMYPNIGDETDFRLNRINEIKYYFTVWNSWKRINEEKV